jgi:hypothetical protein
MRHLIIAAMHVRHLALVALAAGCHVRSTVTAVHPGAQHAEAVAGGRPRAMPATVVVAADGRLRFVAPLQCPADVFVDVERSETRHVEPNLATAVVGIILTVAGAVTLVGGLAEGRTGLGGLGLGGVAVGLPFAIGPWLGNGDTDVARGHESMRKGAGEVACGEMPLTARTASVRSGRFQAFGGVDADGTFEVSPFTWVDAFAPADQPALNLTADLVTDDGIQTIEAVIEASQFAGTRDAFFAAAGIDATVAPLRKVPTLEPGGPKVSRRMIDGRPHLRIVLPIDNTGPGDAWQVRGVIESDNAEIDGRLIYVGHLARGESVRAELLIPLSVAANRELSGGEVELSIVLREAHGAAPDSPAHFKGKILEDVPR